MEISLQFRRYMLSFGFAGTDRLVTFKVLSWRFLCNVLYISYYMMWVFGFTQVQLSSAWVVAWRWCSQLLFCFTLAKAPQHTSNFSAATPETVAQFKGQKWWQYMVLRPMWILEAEALCQVHILVRGLIHLHYGFYWIVSPKSKHNLQRWPRWSLLWSIFCEYPVLWVVISKGPFA
jgi:hypothetical protein